MDISGDLLDYLILQKDDKMIEGYEIVPIELHELILLKKKFIKDQPYYVDMFVEEKTGEIIDEDHTV